jgi:hypothetical protein
MIAPKVIRVYGKARRANFFGETIEREDLIFLQSERAWFRAIDTYDHFVYKVPRNLPGPTIMCTCGSVAGTFQFDAYRQFQSVNMGTLVCCVAHIQNGQHNDGSKG